MAFKLAAAAKAASEADALPLETMPTAERFCSSALSTIPAWIGLHELVGSCDSFLYQTQHFGRMKKAFSL